MYMYTWKRIKVVKRIGWFYDDDQFEFKPAISVKILRERDCEDEVKE